MKPYIALLSCVASVLSFLASASHAQSASGSAVIPPYTAQSGTGLDRDVQVLVSNITGSDTTVEITFYTSTGGILYEASSSPTAGRIAYAVGYSAGTYVENASSGPSVSFTLAAYSTMTFKLTTPHPGTYEENGYGVIRWNKANSDDIHCLVARAANNMSLNGSLVESLVPINNCQPF
jgi:hypothetical protein